MINYNNPESNLRRHIKYCIECGYLQKIMVLTNLTPSCPYNNFGPLDAIYTAVDNNQLDIVQYLVEIRNCTIMGT